MGGGKKGNAGSGNGAGVREGVGVGDGTGGGCSPGGVVPGFPGRGGVVGADATVIGMPVVAPLGLPAASH
jgi:hypothetical protein